VLQARARSSNEIGPRANDSHKLKIATKQLGWRCRVDGAIGVHFRRVIVCSAKASQMWLKLAAGIGAALILLAAKYANATWKPDYAHSPPGWLAWFSQAELTDQARKRFPFKNCCERADRFKTAFRIESGRWRYLSDGQWRDIPDDVIHYENDPKMPELLKQEGVLFIYNGAETCFWPPQTSG